MADIQSILDQIDALKQQLEQMNEEQQSGFVSGDIVEFDRDGELAVGEVESVADDAITVRVLAVSGDNYEPTDDVLTLAPDQVSRMGPDGSKDPDEDEDEGGEPDGEGRPDEEEPPGDDEEEDEEEDDDEDEDEEEKSFLPGQFVKWLSGDGETVGRITGVGNPVPMPDGSIVEGKSDMAAIEVICKHKEKWEPTSVFVAHPLSALKDAGDLDVDSPRLMVKLKDYKMVEDEESDEHSLAGKASAYGKIDLGGDLVDRGAYNQTIIHNDGKVQFMFDHGWKFGDVAGVAYLEDREDGLYVDAKMPKSITRIDEAMDMVRFMIKHGKPLGLSIGYNPIKWEYQEGGIRVLKEIALEEISIVPYPMDTHARIQSAKSRKFAYYSKRPAWQKLSADRKKIDAPTSNHTHEGDYESLCGILKSLKSKIEEHHV